jgi:hypothetical protein
VSTARYFFDGSAGIFLNDATNSDASERPTATRLLEHPFTFVSPSYNFLDTDLHRKLRSETHLEFSRGSGDAEYSSQPGEHEAPPVSPPEHRSLGTGISSSYLSQHRHTSSQSCVMNESSEIDQLLREWTTVFVDNE